MMMKVPPVMLERSEIEEVIAHDHQLDGYEDAKLVFTDISEDLPKNVCLNILLYKENLMIYVFDFFEANFYCTL